MAQHQNQNTLKIITKNSHAKINLFLKLTNKRPDGFHEIESLFAFLDLADILEISISDNFNFKISGEFADNIDVQNNIITKILDYFVETFKISRNIKINLIKNIPVAAGLGGGSSNAAYFMMALNELFSLNLPKKDLQKISTKFGSDIAFFFEDKASIVKGCGDLISEYNKFDNIDALLINPKINLVTKDVFMKFSDKFSSKISNEELQKKDVFDLIKNFSNDLTKPAISILPAIQEILDQLKNNNTEISKMSGSGASCFAIFSDAINLEKARENLTKKFPNFFIKKVKILSNVAH